MPEIISSGYEYCKRTKEKLDLIPSFNMLHFVISGKGIFNGKALEGGMGFLCEKGKRVSYYPDEKEPWVYGWLDFSDSAVLNELFSVIDFDEHKSFLFDKEKPYGSILENNSASSFSDGEYELCDFNRGLYFEILSFLKRDSHRKNHLIQGSQRYNHVLWAERYIENNCHRQKFNIAVLSEEMHLSRAYIHNLFLMYRSISPKQYLLKIRMERASKLLLSVDAPISVVANSVGYGDQFQFSKIFRKYYGVSPSNFRKSGKI